MEIGSLHLGNGCQLSAVLMVRFVKKSLIKFR